MGREAYRVGLIMKALYPIGEMEPTLSQLGAVVTGRERDGFTSMEIAYDEGVLEILLDVAANGGANDLHDALYIRPQTRPFQSSIMLRFAKPSHIGIVDRLRDLLARLDKMNPIEHIVDMESRTAVEANGWGVFKARVLAAKSEFSRWYPGIGYPIRCDDVFKEYNRMNPDKVKRMSTEDFS